MAVSMFSARFDGGEVEATIRAVHEQLVRSGIQVRMVNVAAGGNFGPRTVQYLHEVKQTGGFMIAVCTRHYGEKTASPYSSFAEVEYAINHGLQVLPLRMEDCYPPRPAYGPSHPFDKTGEGQAQIDFLLPPNIVFLDCRRKSADRIAKELMPCLASHGSLELVMPSQPKQARPVIPASGMYAIVNRSSNLMLDNYYEKSGKNSVVATESDGHHPNHKWQLHHVTDEYCAIQNLKSGLFLDHYYSKRDIGEVRASRSDGLHRNHHWRLLPCGGDWFAIVNKCSQGTLAWCGGRDLRCADHAPEHSHHQWKFLPRGL